MHRSECSASSILVRTELPNSLLLPCGTSDSSGCVAAQPSSTLDYRCLLLGTPDYIAVMVTSANFVRCIDAIN